MKETHLYTSDEKLKWFGYGEWVEEPDLIEFTHHEIKCKIVRTVKKESCEEERYFGGSLCGYVIIPIGHELYSKDYQDINIDVHGGLTFGEYNEKEHWIGFDCAHLGDLIPSMELFKIKNNRYLKYLWPIPEELNEYSIFNPTYRNIEFCIQECKSMADQIKHKKLTQ